jgi:hypothetical protein
MDYVIPEYEGYFETGIFNGNFLKVSDFSDGVGVEHAATIAFTDLVLQILASPPMDRLWLRNL